MATHTVWSEGQNQRQRPRSLEEAKAQTLKEALALKEARVTRTQYQYDALGRRSCVQVYSGNGQAQHKTAHTEFLWEGMRLLQERQIDPRGDEAKTQRTVTYVYEPGSYVPLARIDSQAEQGEGTLTRLESQEAANSERYSAGSGGRGPGSGNSASQKAQLYYFHTDTSGLPQELSDAGGALRWRASYQTWGNTVKEEWTALGLNGAAQVEQDPNDIAPQKLEQNLRFQGQYLDRSTGLHYNTFRYYDPDIGRFISPDPIGLAGGDNLYQYAPNPVSWIDPWGWAGDPANSTHVTYRGIDAATGKPYIGYASMPGNQTPEAVIKYRYGGDYSRFGGEPPRAIYSGYGTDGKATARGLEQYHFEKEGGLKGTANKQNPVGQNNAKRGTYTAAADAHVNKPAGGGC